jgi:hypothetical protein
MGKVKWADFNLIPGPKKHDLIHATTFIRSFSVGSTFRDFTSPGYMAPVFSIQLRSLMEVLHCGNRWATRRTTSDAPSADDFDAPSTGGFSDGLAVRPSGGFCEQERVEFDIDSEPARGRAHNLTEIESQQKG